MRLVANARVSACRLYSDTAVHGPFEVQTTRIRGYRNYIIIWHMMMYLIWSLCSLTWTSQVLYTRYIIYTYIYKRCSMYTSFGWSLLTQVTSHCYFLSNAITFIIILYSRATTPVFFSLLS